MVSQIILPRSESVMVSVGLWKQQKSSKALNKPGTISLEEMSQKCASDTVQLDWDLIDKTWFFLWQEWIPEFLAHTCTLSFPLGHWKVPDSQGITAGCEAQIRWKDKPCFFVCPYKSVLQCGLINSTSQFVYEKRGKGRTYMNPKTSKDPSCHKETSPDLVPYEWSSVSLRRWWCNTSYWQKALTIQVNQSAEIL